MTTGLTAALLLLCNLSGLAPVHAGGSNYGIVPVTIANPASKVQEWPVPTPHFARDPAIAPDGSVFVAVMSGNRVARFDPKSQTLREWDMPRTTARTVCRRINTAWYGPQAMATAPSANSIPPVAGSLNSRHHRDDGGPHTLVTADDQSTIWFTMQSGDKVARLDTQSGTIREYESSGGPYGLSIDKAGHIWFCRMGDNKMGKLDPKTGQMSEVSTGRGSRPRRVATAPDGMLWVSYYSNGKLAKSTQRR